MYLNNTWYCLKAKPVLMSEDPVKGLDVSILQDNLLGPFWESEIRERISGLILSEESVD